MRRRSGGTGFVLAYIILEVAYAFADIVRGCFQLLGMLLRLTQSGIDQSQKKWRPGSLSTERSPFEMRFAALVEPFMPTLVAKRSKLLTTDDYGIVRDERWSKEMGYFLGKVILPRLGSDRSFVQRNVPYVAELLEGMIAERQNAITDETTVPLEANDVAFGRRRLQN